MDPRKMNSSEALDSGAASNALAGIGARALATRGT
jgi:hypothetical protein